MTYPVDLSVKPLVKGFFDPATNTISYVVKDPASDACAIVDSVMDIDYAAGRIAYQHADEIIDYVRTNGLRVEWLLETHVHADHLSAAPYIQGKLGGKIGIGSKITVVQETFGKIFNEGTEFQRRVWRALCDIPYGQTVSYSHLARTIGAERAVRAVGAANGANPIAIIVPCHRVIGANGAITGFGGGLPVKRALLDLEQGTRRLLYVGTRRKAKRQKAKGRRQ